MTYHPAGGVGVDPDVPAPPPGPGTAPPFAAPPSDRNKRSLWVWLTVGGLLLVVCCGGSVFGVGALYVAGVNDAKKQATATVTAYLNAVLEQNWELAHQQLCSPLAERISPSDLASRERRQRFESYTLDEPKIAETVDVLAHLSTSGGEALRLFQLDTEGGGRLSICGIR